MAKSNTIKFIQTLDAIYAIDQTDTLELNRFQRRDLAKEREVLVKKGRVYESKVTEEDYENDFAILVNHFDGTTWEDFSENEMVY